ncbi:MAG: response regulator transcription factor [Clostridia bacterium]|nr:response regulator transcription factor [Clostridia bacterium]MBR2413805.1 response regulator transcription factor [Clostridia bacterium]
MKICILDDDAAFARLLGRLITDFDKTNSDLSLTLSDNAYDFYENMMQANGFDIVFISVDLPDENGIAIAEKIKNVFPKTILVLLSEYSTFFSPQAFYCLAKPVREDEFNAVFTLAVKKYMETNRSIVVKWQNKRNRIALDEISFIEGYNRHLIVHTVNGNFETVGKIPDIYAVLQPHGFVRTHQGFIVNMHYIRAIEADSVLLTNGQRVMMSVRMRHETLLAYDNFTDKQCLVI